MLGDVSDDRVFYSVTADGRVVTGYADLRPPDGPADPRGRRVGTGARDGDRMRLASVSRRLAVDGGLAEVTATVAQTQTGQARTLARIRAMALWLGAGFFTLAALTGVLAANTAVRPLRQLTRSVSRRGPRDLRPVADPVPAEMVPLVQALNGFIGRLSVTLSRSEDFIAEAAHRVRTPLATVRAQAEIALHRSATPENRTALAEMITAIDDSSRAAGQLLDHAMVTFRADQLAHEPLDLSALAQETADRLRPVADLKDIALSVDGPPAALVSGDPILLQNAVGNLLDNAIKYSPPGSDVDMTVAAHGAGWTLSIRDGGPGFPPVAPATLTQRFARGPNAEGTVGSGLGLTIAQEVAQAHGGTLTIHPGTQEDGGCVSLDLPRS